MARLLCWYCPNDQPLVLMERAQETTWDGHPVVVLVWECLVCGNGSIRREQTGAKLPLFEEP